MNLKKVLAFLLAAQMLLVSGVACSDTEDETTPSETENKIEETEAPEETEFDRRSVADSLPEITFGGKDFRFYANEGEIFQLVSDDDTGVGLESVIYDRNARVQERFDVKITAEYQLGVESQDVINSYAQSGEHIAEVFDHWHRMGLTPPCYAMSLNWLDLPHLDWDKPWWNKKSNDDSTINGKLWTVTGDLAVTAMQDTWAIAFNMDLIKDYGYTSEQLYQLVLDGEWTLDKFIEVGSSMYKDVNGNGQEDPGDVFGYLCDVGDRTMPWVTALGEKFFTKTEDGMGVEVTLGTEKTYQALEKLINFHHNVVGTYSVKAEPEEARNTRAEALAEFVNGTVGLFPTTFNPCFVEFTDLTFSYGMLPFPKYDTAQETYMTVPEYDFSIYGVPVTLPFEDYEMVGVIMEALMAESWKTVSPAYYDEALKGRYTADATTAEVIDLIMDGRVYDWGYQIAQFIDTYKVPYLFCYQIRDNDIDMASSLAEGESKIQAAIDVCLSFYED
ncbi:MAG: hypothetical protein E7638_01480 [Ruminococcaceae bacterium]|nr:hypothetical protein [Oscillospiraceae bacterium]